MPILLALFLAFAAVGPAAALEGSQSTAATAVKGEVLYWEGEELVVKEMSGREVRLRVTPETKLEGVVSRLKTGDKITAQLTPEGRTLSITLQIPESGAGAISPVPR
jgi:Cu/Ag efflux protein CusF